MVLWVNLPGSFLFGIALTGYLAGEAVLVDEGWPARCREARRWGGFVAATIAASLINANGITALVQPFRLMAMPALQAGFGEWQPADLANFPALGLWLAGAAALMVLARRQLPWTRLVLLLGLAYMALAHVRHADLLGLAGPLAVAAALSPPLTTLLRPAAASLLLQGVALLARPSRLPGRFLIVVLATALSLPVLLHSVDRSSDAVTPQAALTAARRMNLTGPVFNSEAFGGYLIFSGVPTFIDGRVELYGNDFLAAYLKAERGDGAVLAELLDRYHITWALLQTPAPAVAALDRLPGWRRVYGDDQAVVYRRGD
jgi:hypothetical protein